jgi:hypothetical protein
MKYKISLTADGGKGRKQSIESNGDMKDFVRDLVIMIDRYDKAVLPKFMELMKEETNKFGQQSVIHLEEVKTL